MHDEKSELTERLSQFGSNRKMYDYLKDQGVQLQAYGTMMSKLREVRSESRYRPDDLCDLIIRDEEDQERILQDLRSRDGGNA